MEWEQLVFWLAERHDKDCRVMPHGKQKELMTGGLYLIYETCMDIREAVAHIDIAYGHFHLLLPKKLRLHFELSFYALLLKQQDTFFLFIVLK